jgi:hypothetical protein
LWSVNSHYVLFCILHFSRFWMKLKSGPTM